MMAVYASFAITLLTLTWLWLSWLILLLGCQLAFYLQNPRYLRTGRRLLVASPRLAERLAISTMIETGRAFQTGGTKPTLAGLAERFDVAGGVLTPIVDCLERAGLLVETADGALVPGRALGTIGLAAIVGAIRDGTDTEHTRLCEALTLDRADATSDSLEQAIKAHFAGKTLLDLLDT